MRSIVRLLVLACLAAAVLVPAASGADRMWVGFQDDPMFRWDDTRLEALDRARSNNASILRTIVDWSKVAPERPAQATDPFDPAYQFGDVDEFVRRVAQRAHVEPEEARTGAVAVLVTVREAVTSGELHDVLSQLPQEYRELVGPWA